MAAVLLVVLTACAGDGADDEVGPEPTGTETATPRPTPTRGDTPPEGDGTVSGDQVFVLAPQQPVTTTVSEPQGDGGEGRQEFAVIGRRGEEALPPTIDVTFLPCGNVRFEPGRVVFTDEDGDGAPDDIGHSDRGEAFVFSLNGVRYDPEGDNLVTDVEVEDGRVRFSLDAEGPDCAVPVVWTDRDGDLEVDLGRSPEPFSAGKITWREG